MSAKVIINCEIPGLTPGPSKWPRLSATPTDIGLSALEAGATILHIHARNPQDGRPGQSPGAFKPRRDAIKLASNIVVKITEDLGLAVAAAGEAREILAFRGADQVAS